MSIRAKGSITPGKNGTFIVRWSVRDAKSPQQRKQKSKQFSDRSVAESFLQNLRRDPAPETTDISVLWLLKTHGGDALAAIRYLMCELRLAKQHLTYEKARRVEAEDGALFRYLMAAYGEASAERRTTDPIHGQVRLDEAKRAAEKLLRDQAPTPVRTKDILAICGVKKGSSSLQLLRHLEAHPKIRKDDFKRYQWVR